MKSSLRLRHKLLFISFVFFILVFFSGQSVISSGVSQSLQAFLLRINRNTNLKISCRDISFKFLSGLRLNELAIGFDKGIPVFKAKQIIVKPFILPLFFKKFVIKDIRLDRAGLVITGDNTQGGYFMDIIKLIAKELSRERFQDMQVSIFGLDIFINNSQIVFLNREIDKSWPMFVTAKVSLTKTGSFRSDGEIFVKYKFSRSNIITNFFPKNELIQNFGFNLEGRLREEDVYINNIILAVGYERIFGKGLIKNYQTKEPVINFGITSSNFTLEAVSSIKGEYNFGGPLAFSGRLVGRPPKDLQFNLKTTLFGCRLVNYSQELDIKNIVGRLDLSNDSLDAPDTFLIINNCPLKINLSVHNFQNPDFFIKAVSKHRFYAQNNFSGFEALLKGSRPDKGANFQGELKLKTTLLDEGGAPFEDLLLNLNGINLSVFEGPASSIKPFEVFSQKFQAAQFLFNTIPRREGPLSPRKLEFLDLGGSLSFKDKQLILENLSLKGYEGRIFFDLAFRLNANSPVFVIKLKTEDLNIVKLAQDLSVPENLSGRLYVNLTLDNSSHEYFQGAIDLREGKISGVLMIDALSDFMRLRRLKNLEFNNLHTDLKFNKDGPNYYNFKLTHPDINMESHVIVDKDNNLKGNLLVSISDGMLKESGQFRRLLAMLNNQAPFIDFAFQIGGLTGAPRFSLLRNEFKQGLQRILSKGRQNVLEDNINNMVDELFQQGKK
ncbi:MAG: hypothetical protein V1674_01555 [Candidatus Omnitrophota bacterium]